MLTAKEVMYQLVLSRQCCDHGFLILYIRLFINTVLGRMTAINGSQAGVLEEDYSLSDASKSLNASMTQRGQT